MTGINAQDAAVVASIALQHDDQKLDELRELNGESGVSQDPLGDTARCFLELGISLQTQIVLRHGDFPSKAMTSTLADPAPGATFTGANIVRLSEAPARRGRR
jgi:hypothetical protein